MSGEQQPSANPPAPWELVVMISGAVVLIGSFLPFRSLSAPEFDLDLTWNAWANALNLFPVSALVVLYALVAAGHVALTRFAGVTGPDRIAGTSWTGLRLLLGTLATLTMLGYAFRDWPEAEIPIDRGFGLYLMLIGAIGVLVGAVMEHVARSGPPASPPAAPATKPTPSPGRLVIMIAGGVLLVASFLDAATSEGESVNAWEDPLFPLFVIPVALGVVMAVHIAVTTFTTAGIPERVLGIEWSKVHVAFGAHAALMMLGFLIGNFFFTVFGEPLIPEPDRDPGFWLMLVGALGLAVGAILYDREIVAARASSVPGSSPPASPPQPPRAPAEDAPPGPGWWKASDGRWYPPDQQPGGAP